MGYDYDDCDSIINHKEMCYQIPNPDHNEWLAKYNEMVVKYVHEGKLTKSGKGHHILPRSLYPEAANDLGNILELDFKEHIDLHYYLWKADPRYAPQLWFGAVYGIKNGLWNLYEEGEYEQLKRDVSRYRKYTPPKTKKSKN